MSSVDERAHLSIGEVLSLLQEDFPDVSISKIRFLESQGLLDPERTPSGYRKFYDADIVRLRWILRQQRENFLPLKVIKDRLANGQADLGEAGGGAAGRNELERALAGPPADDERARDEADQSAAPGPASSASVAEPTAAAVEAPQPVATAEPAAAGSTTSDAPPAEAAPPTADHAPPAAVTTAATPASAPVGAGPTGDAASTGTEAPATDAPARRNLLEEGPRAVSLTLDELASATGLLPREITELESFGMIAGRDGRFDEEALTIARLASSFRGHGVEPRHLRMFKMAAQREIGLFEQMLLPILRKSSPSAKREAAELATELIGLGDELRAAMLRQHLRDHIDRA